MSEPVCICGHLRNLHDIEPPYWCNGCECRGFTYPIELVRDRDAWRKRAEEAEEALAKCIFAEKRP